jgi:PAS domain S-box-containing protein
MNEARLLPRSALNDAFLVRLDDTTRPQEAPEEITRSAARLLGQYLDVDRCAYADVEEDEDTFNLTGDYNRDVPSIVGRYRFMQFGAECLRLMRAGEPYVVEDSEADERTIEVRSVYRQTIIRAVICVPLHKAGRFVAAMAVHQRVPRTWRSDEVALVQKVANRCWESIERARIGRELRASEARLRAALEAARQVAWECDVVSQEMRCSHTASGVLGITLDHGRAPISAWNDCIHPEDRSGRAMILERACQHGEIYRAQFRWRRPDDGSVIWVEENGRPDCDTDGHMRMMSGVIVDITQRKIAEIERERFFTIGLDLMVVVGFDGHLHRVSPSWEQTLGWTTHELTSQPWISFIHPDDQMASMSGTEQLFAGRDTTMFENRYRHKAGGWRWLSWKLKAFPEERLLYGAASDITERKRSQERDAFLIALDDALRTLADPQEIIRVASRMLCEQLQADRCVHCIFDPDGENFELTEHPLHPGLVPMGGRMTLQLFGSATSDQLRGNRPATSADIMADIACSDVREQFLRFGIRSHVSVPLAKDGRIAAMWAVHQSTPREWQQDEIDLVRRVADRCWESVERAHASAHLRQQWHLFDSALSHTPDFTYIFDLEGRFLYANRPLLSLWQKSLEEVMGRNFYDLGYPPELAERLQRQIQEVIATHNHARDTTPFTLQTGETRHYEYIFVPIFAETGEVRAVAGSTRDITEHLQIEAELRQANDKLSRSNRELEQFAYIVSHDLQEPLRMVSSFVMLLEQRVGPELNETARGYIARVIHGTARMKNLIRDLLTYARVGEDRPFVSVDLAKVLSIAVDNLTVRIEEAQATVTSDPLPQVRGDELQLIQLFQNLMGNAIKFRAPSRLPEIHISATHDNGSWRIAIHDNGIGISDHQRQRIFEVFHRLHARSEYEGSGIGLAICKVIVEKHGGTITVESQEGVGSTFIIRLPYVDQTAS